MDHSITERPVPLATWQLTYSPAHKPSGTPLNPHASRQVMAQRLTTTIEAPTADAATGIFEREKGLMVTACERLQSSPGAW